MISITLNIIVLKSRNVFSNFAPFAFLLTCYPVALRAGPISFPKMCRLISFVLVLSDASLILL